ncbi:MAG: N-acetylmuramoyl-L-alanine amidase [Nocardioidaceae bacterium]
MTEPPSARRDTASTGVPHLSRRALLRGALTVSAAAAVGGVDLAWASTARAVSMPSIAACDTWGAQPATGTISINAYRPTKVVIHHTASANSTDFSQAHAYALSRSIQQSHFDRGWIDTGQHFTVSRGGFVTEGRHRTLETLAGGASFVLGAHCTGQNSYALGIENEGTYTTTTPPSAQYDKLVDLVAYLCQTYAIPTSEIYGHRDFVATECPGDAFYAQLPALRSAVAAKLGTPPPPARSWPTLQQGSAGFRVTTAQYLLRQHGSSISADGDFGPATASAVSSFQSANGLAADGIIGAQTWERLVVTVAQGSSGEAVRGAQTALTARGYAATVDGVFGSGTKSAVVSFQQSRGLSADGMVGPDTWAALVA